jgi:NAD+ synthase
MPSANSFLKIEETRAAECIEKYIRDLVHHYSARGVLIGLSGGLDSAVLSALAARALGKDSVHVSYLYDRDSERRSEHNARVIADWLGLKLELQDIEPALREMGVYKPLIMRLSSPSGPVSSYLASHSDSLMFAESPFMPVLRQGKCRGGRLERFIYHFAVKHIEAGFNARHIYRRKILEKQAKDQNLLLLGAANRSEYLVGWFVREGIDDLPFSPLMGLYKTQVRQLASYLRIRSEIRSQVPSPDMMRGITDEFAMGVSYSRIDMVLDGMDRGLSDEEMMDAGVSKKDISRVRDMNHLSTWKRDSQHDNPPVDGSTRGGLRLP